MAFQRVKALGLIRDDAGDDNSRTEIGKNSRPEKSELCVRSASVERAAKEFPVKHKLRDEYLGDVIVPLHADEMTKSVNALSKDEVDNANEGKTIYGFNR